MAINTNPLQQLKDIHLPDAVAMWPQTPAWYVAALILLSLFVVGLIYGLRNFYTHQRRKKIRQQLKVIMENYRHDPAKSFESLSQLVRRIVLVHYKREQVASLRGDDWLKCLDDLAETHEFSNGVGRILVTAPYQKQVTTDINLLNGLLEKLIRKVL